MPDARAHDPGLPIAEALVENGASVALFDRDAKLLDETAHNLRQQGGQVLALPGDVTDDAAVTAAIAETTARLGPLGICIANAGISDARPGPLHRRGPDRSPARHRYRTATTPTHRSAGAEMPLRAAPGRNRKGGQDVFGRSSASRAK